MTEEDYTVLWAEDNQDLREIGSIYLQRFGLSVVEAADGEEAYQEFMDREEIDGIISDYNMPGMDGLELLEEIRLEDSEIPFILFTGKGGEEVAEDAMSMDVSDYQQKSSGVDQYHVLANRMEHEIERLEAMEEACRWREDAESFPIGLAKTDSEGCITYINLAMEDMTGLKKGSAEGLEFSDIEGYEFYTEMLEEDPDDVRVEESNFQDAEIEQSVVPVNDGERYILTARILEP